jgi:FkbM family methyltransferase
MTKRSSSTSSITRHDPRERQLLFQPDGPINRMLTTLAHALHRRGQLWRANFTVSGRLAGRPLRVPLLFGAGWEHLRMRELWLFRALEEVMQQRPGAVVDVGVNVGHTLIKVKTADPDRDYVGFEPNPQCLRYTEQLVAVNRFRRVTVVPVGISNRTGVMKFLLNLDVDPSATLVEGFREPTRYTRRMLVPVFVGDDLLDSLGVGNVAAIKIDVEGGELDVVEGLERTLRRDQPFVFCEVLPVFPGTEIAPFRLRRQAALGQLLAGLGYTIFRMHVDATAEEVDGFGVHADMTLANYVFVPRAELERVRARGDAASLDVELGEHRAVV